MDLYRFFHPHYNPRLRNRQLRQQELSELGLAAKELLRVLERTLVRLSFPAAHPITSLLDSETTNSQETNSQDGVNKALETLSSEPAETHIIEAGALVKASSEALELAVELLSQAIEGYPEDSEEDMLELLEERKTAPGWEAWCRLLKERIEMVGNSSFTVASSISGRLIEIDAESLADVRSDLDDSFPTVSTLHNKKIVSA